MSFKAGFYLVFPVVALGAILAGDARGQIVQRYPGGGVAIRAPFVRVDVGPNGGTSVRAPFVAVDDPGFVQVGPRRRLLRRQHRAERRALEQAEQEQGYGQVQTKPPTLAASPPLPGPGQLEAMNLVELLAALRDLSRVLHVSLERFDDPTGWQGYLEIPENALGTPGVEDVAIDLTILEKQLGRYQTVASDAEFAKIARLEAFRATLTALELVVERFHQEGPALGSPEQDHWQNDPGPVTSPEDSSFQRGELLVPPSPEPPGPEPRSGERSILKRR